MATNPITKQLYPFSTEDGKTIPLDIIRPLSLIQKSFQSTGSVDNITIPGDWELASFYSVAGCIIQFAEAPTLPNPPAENTPYADTLLVPPNCLVISTVIPGNARVISINADRAGKLVAQKIQKWAGIALARQAGNR